MEKLKQYVNGGQLEIAKLDDNNKPQSVPLSQLQNQVNRQQKNIDIYKSLGELSWEEKYEWVNLKRLKANQKYQNGQYDDAIQIYIDSLLGIDLNDDSHSRLHQMKYQLQFPITLNLATCLFKKQEFKKAIQLCKKILDQDPKHLPAIYKKTYLLLKTGDLISAKQLLDEGIKVAKQTGSKEQQKSLYLLSEQINKASKQNKQIYAKMFNLNSTGIEESESNQRAKLLNKQNSNSSENSEDEDNILYYEEETICNRFYGCVKGSIFYILPWLKNRNEKSTSSKSH